jgi:hypothetical protein
MRKSRARDSRKRPKESRTIPLLGNQDRGNGEDFGKYYRCWNCGFTCDVTRDSLGGSQSKGADNHEDYHTPSYGSKDYSSELNGLSVLGGDVGHYHVALELGSDGNPKNIRHDIKSVVTGGCPFCGTMNWRGDY